MLFYTKLATSPSPELAKLLNDANHPEPPENWREIPATEVHKTRWGVYTPDYMGYMQVFVDEAREHRCGVQFFVFFDMTGVAILIEHWPNPGVRWFRFGCEHDYQETDKTRGFDHVVKCSKCGNEWGYDSSG
jgi:hypothetical protein